MLTKVFLGVFVLIAGLSVRWGVSVCPSVPDQDSGPNPNPQPQPLTPTEGEADSVNEGLMSHHVFTWFDRRAALLQKKTTSSWDFSSASFPRVLRHVLLRPPLSSVSSFSPPSIHVRLFIAIEGRHNIGSTANQRGNTRTQETDGTLQGSLRRRHNVTESAGGPEC